MCKRTNVLGRPKASRLSGAITIDAKLHQVSAEMTDVSSAGVAWQPVSVTPNDPKMQQSAQEVQVYGLLNTNQGYMTAFVAGKIQDSYAAGVTGILD